MVFTVIYGISVILCYFFLLFVLNMAETQGEQGAKLNKMENVLMIWSIIEVGIYFFFIFQHFLA